MDERARAQAVVDGDADAAMEHLTPEEQAEVLRLLRQRVQASRAAVGLIPSDRVGSAGRRAKRAKGKAARAARKRNRR
jgi:predicted Fe-S protein YdhL (DUF1289 family)